ncbi:leucine-rich repeat-containing protein 18-like [Oreochromis niloticus]|uniref:Leucine rich repeat containing 18b n=1 Tax=Oreochromis niloticus TaxID=8128 RepID=A0A669CXZ3_ORENI|nr:leucine-rich repeat-containing protein 18-like [Oreochromis niloticus]XP_019209121.1 leucine-rich repeat-containing protein 18-like [Oreochromis niloticus]XP_019209122.1 leucine-rich repeat-containing protein 18-like [Oreochromis niloticus]
MAKRTKAKRETKSKKMTLKMAQNCVELTLDGKHRLDLSFKGVTAVPKCVQKLFHMAEVDLSRNMIRKFPDFIAQFIKMTVLDLHSNCLEELPVAISYLQNLKVLNLCNNRLTSLPSELGLLNKLQTLNLGLNQLEALPASIGALEELRHIGLSDNRFTRLPGCLLKLKKLESIKMDRNPIIAEKIPTEKPGPQRFVIFIFAAIFFLMGLFISCGFNDTIYPPFHVDVNYTIKHTDLKKWSGRDSYVSVQGKEAG